jgi:hypothetical protein
VGRHPSVSIEKPLWSWIFRPYHEDSMRVREIILLAATFFATTYVACDSLAQPAETPGPVFTVPGEDCATPPPVFVEAPADCSTSQPVFLDEQLPMGSPPYPVTSGPMFGPPGMVMPGTPEFMMPGAPLMVYPNAPPAEAGSPAALPAAPPTRPLDHLAPGGTISPRFGLPAGPDAAPGPNPIQVPVANDEAAWEQIVDVVVDYFPVAREQQARRSGPVWSEGKIETSYTSGATIFEPFRKNSVGAFNRWESTFQTIRRNAVVRVIPDAVGFLVEVEVQKELEDLPRPENATAGAAVFRTTGSLPTDRHQAVSRLQSSPRWIPLGRDPALEGRMLADIQARFTQPPDSSWPAFWW